MTLLGLREPIRSQNKLLWVPLKHEDGAGALKQFHTVSLSRNLQHLVLRLHLTLKLLAHNPCQVYRSH